jgi:tRNA 2-selenouridine synthase
VQKVIPISIFLEKLKTTPLIDVRSEGEYQQAHIPGAISLPLFNNEERALIGTAYKKVSQEHAMLMGLDFVGPKMSGFVKRAKKLAPNNEILVHCWRGGMRSQSFAMLLNTFGFKVFVLEGGYKAYRNFVLETFKKQYQLTILSGKTGSGKTDMLKALELKGEQIIDLEGLANHKGSSFGMLGQKPQPSTEMFENLMTEKLLSLDETKNIWVEDESRSVGKCGINLEFWNQMLIAKMIYVEVPENIRIKRLVAEYSEFSYEELKASTDAILKRLGGQNHQEAMRSLEEKDFETATQIALRYYDKAYLNSIQQRNQADIDKIEISENDIEKTASMILIRIKS